VELHTAPKLNPARGLFDRCEEYLERLAIDDETRRALMVRVRGMSAKSVREAMAALHRVLADGAADSENPAYHSIDRRLELAYGTANGGRGKDLVTTRPQRPRLVTTPPLNRSSMVPQPWAKGWLARVLRPWGGNLIVPGASRQRLAEEARSGRAATPDHHPGTWHGAGLRRRIVLLGLVIVQTVVATEFMSAVLPYHGGQPLETLLLVLFAILFGWVSAGFWTAMAGFFLLLVGRDQYAISRSAAADAPIAEDARTAIVMPVCNEHVARVFAGLRATYRSVAMTGELEHFDFFVLSDSSTPETRVAEVAAWLELSRAVGGFGRIFYRWRRHRIKRKSGNVADFCRRWGKNYRYMIVLDADSVMSGACITSLVRIAEANPTAGIIQTAPRAAGRETLYARMQQFATCVYGPLFTAGLHFWQLGESHYWGHNAIIRVAPFIRHCALGRLPGRGSLSGEILSHDFVEAALMRRAGWAVWIAYDLPGSYEEMPPNLIDELKRDRRWCQGNLMNFRLFLMKGLHPAHRAVFMTGVMAYLSAPLWFAFLIVSTWLLADHALKPPTYFPEPYQLFPVWPEWHPEWAIALFSATATLLFLPKIFGMLLLGAKGTHPYGDGVRLVASTVAEMIISALLAPIRMLFHTRFVLTALLGWTVSWKSPAREDAATTWTEAVTRHGTQTLFGVAWAIGVYWLDPAYLWWLLPIIGALIISIPLSVFTSRTTLGQSFRRARLFLIPEESWPPLEIRLTGRYLRRATPPPDFVDAVVDPVVNALACASGGARTGQASTPSSERMELLQKTLVAGPESLTEPERATLLDDPIALSCLHFEVWTAEETHPRWGAALQEPKGVSAQSR
jgi:membrane glycosyltransferase